MFLQTELHSGTAVRIGAFERRAAGQQSVCIRKVLRPANFIKVFVVFLGIRAEPTLHCVFLVQLAQR
jgi:hypothetical protein